MSTQPPLEPGHVKHNKVAADEDIFVKEESPPSDAVTNSSATYVEIKGEYDSTDDAFNFNGDGGDANVLGQACGNKNSFDEKDVKCGESAKGKRVRKNSSSKLTKKTRKIVEGASPGTLDRKLWTTEERLILLNAVLEYLGDVKWLDIAGKLSGRNANMCQKQWGRMVQRIKDTISKGA